MFTIPVAQLLYTKDRNLLITRKDPTKNHSLRFNMQHSISVSRDFSMEWIRQMHQSRLRTMFRTSNRLRYLYMSMRSDLHTSQMTFWFKTVYCHTLYICHQHDKSRFLFYIKGKYICYNKTSVWQGFFLCVIFLISWVIVQHWVQSIFAGLLVEHVLSRL